MRVVRSPGRSTPGGAGPRRRWWSCRRGRCGRPCRGGSVSSRSRIESMIVGKWEYDRPVAPGPPGEEGVAGEDGAAGPGAYRQTAPGAWPGVCSTVRSTPATRDDLAVGELSRRAPGRGGSASTAAGRRGGARSARRCARRARARRRCGRCGRGCTRWPAAVRSPTAVGDGVGVVGGVDDDRPRGRRRRSTRCCRRPRCRRRARTCPEVTRCSMRAAIRAPPPSAGRRRRASARRPSRRRRVRSSR